MNLKVKLFLIFLQTIFFSYAQESARTLTLKEAVKIGLEKSLDLNQQRNILVSSQVSKTSSMLLLGPRINITGNLGRNDGNSFNQQEGDVVNGVIDFFGANINANMPLFNGFNSLNAFKQSSTLYEAQIELLGRTEQDAIRNVANQYLNCLLDKQLLQIQEQNLETQRQLYNQIKEHVAIGSRPEVDLVNQEYQMKNAELLVLRARVTFRNDLATLSQILQLDPLIQFEVNDPDFNMDILTFEDQNIDEFSEIALTNRGDLSQARLNEKAAQFGYKSSRGGYFPNLSLFAQYGSRYNYIHDYSGNRGFEQQFREDNMQLAYGLTFTIPIAGAYQTRSVVVNNKIAFENAKLQSENTEITVKNDVLRAYQNYRDALRSYEVSSAQLKASELSYELERERYDLGISDIVILAQANQNYFGAQSDFAIAKYTLMFQKILMNYATGTLRLEDIP